MSHPNVTNVSNESEVIVYCLITDFEGLSQAASAVHQEQYEVKPLKPGRSNGKVRVRKETINGIDTYSLTTKVDQGAVGDITKDKEYTIAIDREYFDAFALIAGSGMIKTRYKFPFEKAILTDETAADISRGLTDDSPCFEVDVFSDAEGNKRGWCKVDIELDGLVKMVASQVTDEKRIKITAKLSGLPFKPTNIFIGSKATPEQNAILDILYKEVFTLKLV